MLLRLCVVLLVVCCPGWTEVSAQGIGQLYQEGTQAFQKKQYKKAMRALRKLLPLLRKSQKGRRPGTRAWHMWTLAQSEVYYYFARIDLVGGRLHPACQNLRRVLGRVRTLPSGWRQWGVAAKQLNQVKEARRLFRVRCRVKVTRRTPPSSPRWLRFQGTPTSAQVSLLVDGKWVVLPAKRVPARGASITAKVSARGFQSQVFREIALRPSGDTLVSYALKPTKKTPVVVAWYQSPWPWVAVGGALVAGITLGALIAVAAQSEGSPSGEALTSRSGGGFRLWHTTP